MSDEPKADDANESAERGDVYLDEEEFDIPFELPVFMVIVAGGGAALLAMSIRWLIGFTQP